jgi:hypothetical protein
MFSLLRRAQTARATPVRRHSFHPRLEVLEDRTLPDTALMAALADSASLTTAPPDQQTPALVAQEKSAITDLAGTWKGHLVGADGVPTAASLTIIPQHERLAFAQYIGEDGTVATGNIAFNAAGGFAGSLKSAVAKIEIQGEVVTFPDGNRTLSASLLIHTNGGVSPEPFTLYAAQTIPDFPGPFIGGLQYDGSSQSNLSSDPPMSVTLTQDPMSNSIGGSITFAVNGTSTDFTILSGVVNTNGMLDLKALATDGSNFTLQVSASFTFFSFPDPFPAPFYPACIHEMEVAGTYQLFDATGSLVDTGMFTVFHIEIVRRGGFFC